MILALRLPAAPILVTGMPLRACLADRTPQQYSNGRSDLNVDILREGVVIRPWLAEHADQQIRGVGRAILKQRSPDYLAKSEL